MTYRINVLKEGIEKSPEKAKRNNLSIAKVYFKKEEFTKSIKILNDLIAEDPDYYEAIYVRARFLSTLILKDEESTRIDELAIISKLINELEKIPIHDNKYSDAQTLIHRYNEYLPEKIDAVLFPTRICEETNMEYHVWLKRDFLDEKIKIRFRQFK